MCKTTTNKYKVFVALHEEARDPCIWIPNDDKVNSGDCIKVQCTSTQKKVYCECRVLDDNYINYYNDRHHTNKIREQNKAIIISEYYRKKLGNLKSGENYDFEIDYGHNCCLFRLFSIYWHPDRYFQLAIIFAVISILLSFISLIAQFFL